MEKTSGVCCNRKGGNLTSFFQVLGMDGPIRVIGARFSQNQLRLFVQHFQFLKQSTGSGQDMNTPRRVRAPEQTAREEYDEHLK